VSSGLHGCSPDRKAATGCGAAGHDCCRRRLVRQEALADLAHSACPTAWDPVQCGRQMSRGQDRRIRPRRGPSDRPPRFGEAPDARCSVHARYTKSYTNALEKAPTTIPAEGEHPGLRLEGSCLGDSNVPPVHDDRRSGHHFTCLPEVLQNSRTVNLDLDPPELRWYVSRADDVTGGRSFGQRHR
jgi:hypothetical protein